MVMIVPEMKLMETIVTVSGGDGGGDGDDGGYTSGGDAN